METNLDQQINTYIRKVSSQIPANYPNKDSIIQTIRQNINNFRAEHPDASFDDVLEEFGAVTEVAASFLEELPEQEISDILRRKRRILHLSAALFLVCIMILLAVLRYLDYWADEEALVVHEGMYIYGDTEETSEIIEKILDGEDLSNN